MTDAPEPFRILDRKLVYRGFSRIESLQIEQIRRSGVPMRMTREVETHGNGVAVLAFDPERRLAVLVRQLRVPVGLGRPQDAYLLEAIAGLIDKDSGGAADTARREALEEAGLELTNLTAVAGAFTSPGLSTELLVLFIAEVDVETSRVGAGGGLEDEHEDIEIVEIPLSELAAMADTGQILDMKTFALIQTLRLRRPDLFD